MKYSTILLIVFMTLGSGSGAEAAGNPYEGTVWRLNILGHTGERPNPACITFHPGGRFSMSGRSSVMLWDTHPLTPYVFNVVTSPQQNAAVTEPFGVHGYMSWGNKLLGAGIDANGYAFKFEGSQTDSCQHAGIRNESVADSGHNRAPIDPGLLTVSNPTTNVNPCTSVSCSQPDPLPPPGEVPDEAIAQTVVNETQNSAACQGASCEQDDGGVGRQANNALEINNFQNATIQVNPCTVSWCAPPDNLLSLANPAYVTQQTTSASEGDMSRLIGKLYKFALTDKAGNTSKHCWYFGANRSVTSYRGDKVLWVSDDLLTTLDRGFQSIGTGANGHGMAIQGAVWDEERLYVQGIEAFDSTAIMSYGWGTISQDCNLADDAL